MKKRPLSGKRGGKRAQVAIQGYGENNLEGGAPIASKKKEEYMGQGREKLQIPGQEVTPPVGKGKNKSRSSI